MRIDGFTHCLPERYLDTGRELLGADFIKNHIGTDMTRLYDFEQRIRDMDEAGIDKQIATMPVPAIDQISAEPEIGGKLAGSVNNAMADIANRYGERVLTVGTVALNDVEGSAREAERAIKQLGLTGILLYTNSGGHGFDSPALEPFWQTMSALGKPIWIHPTHNPMFSGLKYGMAGTFGWPFNTTICMTELIFGGVLDRHPGLKFITHHGGALVPFFEQRIAGGGAGPEAIARLTKPVADYYRMFYVDTAIGGSMGALHATCSFYEPDHILLGTDYPYGQRHFLRSVASVDMLPIPPAQREQICSGTIQHLLGV